MIDVMFPQHQARNIAVCIQFRDSDDETAAPLKVSCVICCKMQNATEHLIISPLLEGISDWLF